MPKLEQGSNGSATKKVTKTKAAATPKSAKEPKKAPSNTSGRPIVYDKVVVNGVVIPEENTIITSDMAKQLLGWEEESDQVKFGDSYTLTYASEGKTVKVRCTNNDGNRPFNEQWCRTLAQDVLNKHWQFNLETIIISKTGRVESGQHRLIGLVLACAEWSGPQKAHWQLIWPQEPTIRSLVAFGAEENAEVTRTLDNVRPRTLGDVLFCDSSVFGDTPPNARKQLVRMVEHTVRLLWARMGQDNNAFAPYRTHSESLDFIARHLKILECARHIYEENGGKGSGKDGPISKWISAGYASAVLYLMGASRSDLDTYRNADTPSEALLDWSTWEKACEFWVEFGQSVTVMKLVRQALAGLADPETGAAGSRDEQLAILAHAWPLYLEGQEITDEDLQLKYGTDEDGMRFLLDAATFGGVDMGADLDERDGEADETEQEESQPGPSEEQRREETARKIKEAHEAKRNQGTGAAPNPPQRPAPKPRATKVLPRPLNKREK